MASWLFARNSSMLVLIHPCTGGDRRNTSPPRRGKFSDLFRSGTGDNPCINGNSGAAPFPAALPAGHSREHYPHVQYAKVEPVAAKRLGQRNPMTIGWQ